MKKQVLFVGVLLCFLVSKNLRGQEKEKEKVEKLDEIVVTATKFQLKKENTGKVIQKITQKQLEQNAGKSIIEILNSVVGIDIRGVNANPTEPRSINIRGGRSRQVLILIDGVPVTDQSAINQEFDLRLLAINQIESIEILKGASSTLYGSGAATGVINITLKKASNDKISGALETSWGTNNTANNSKNKLLDRNLNANINGTLNKFNFLASFNILGVAGMSSAKNNTDTFFEEDLYSAKNGLLKLGYTINQKLSIASFLNFDTFKNDFDGGAFLDSDVNKGTQEQFRFGIKPRFVYGKGEVYALISLNSINRSLDQFNSFANTLDNYKFEGRSFNVDLVSKHEFSSKIQLITGINYQEHRNNTITPFAKIDEEIANFNTLDPYASLVYISNNGFSVNAGGRLNIHNVYGTQFVYDGNIAYSILKNETNTIKLLSSYSTAFIAPSLYQLYDGFAGNLDLNPESNETFEAGFDLNYKDWLQFDAVYFNRKEVDAIIYDNTTFKYANGSSDAHGFEINTNVMPTSFLNINASYTFVDRDQFEDFNDYIPKNKWVGAVDFTGIKNLFINLTYRNVGERSIFDRYGSFGNAGEDVILENYQVLDVMTNYKLWSDTVTVFGAITNLLNEDYDDIFGYSTRGINYKLGIRFQF
jgi:vitamin B12 transporter